MAEAAPTTGLGNLVQLTISGLIGSRTRTVDFVEGAPTVITGRNGSGKSTILRCIDAIGRADWYGLYRLPFEQIHLDFEDGTRVHVAKTAETLDVSIGDESWSPPLKELQDDFHRFLVEDDTISLTDAEVRRRVLHGGQPPSSVLKRIMVEQAPWLDEFIDEFEVLFITDQRLVIEERPRRPVGAKRPDRPVPTTAAVEISAKIVARHIQASLSAYATHSQELDRRFPSRVVKAMQSGAKVNLDDLSESLEELSQARKRMQDVGLLPREELPFGPDLDPGSLEDERVRTVIETYVTDTQEKLGVLEGLQRRLSLLTSFLNGHYVEKRIEIDAEEGLVARRTSGDGETLDLTDLSSGEQQMLVLAFEILFRARHGTLLLIDEPELSLHVLWQDTLIDDLAAMGAVQDVQFIMATHSPTLLGARLDLQRSLDSEA